MYGDITQIVEKNCDRKEVTAIADNNDIVINVATFATNDKTEYLKRNEFGGIPVDLSKKQFLQGVSKPVNKRLFEIFKTCGFAEESGHGVPTVTKAYGNDSYIFDGKFIKVVIPFNISNKSNTTKETTKEIVNTTQETTQEIANTTQEKIINLLRANALLTRKDLSILLKLSEDGIQYHLNQLKKKGIIEHKGATKSGYWLVKNFIINGGIQ